MNDCHSCLYMRKWASFPASLSHDIYAAYLNIFFYKTTHICDRSAIEIDESENFQDNFIHTYHFSLVKIQRNENRSPTEIHNEEC